MKNVMIAGAALLLFSNAAVADVRETEEFFDWIALGSDGGDAVEVTAHKKAGNQEYLDDLVIDIDASSNQVRIETKHPNRSGWFNWSGDSSGSVMYEITVPSSVELDAIETVNGDVEIDSVGGDVSASTVNGAVTVSGVSSDLDLETVNGSLKAVLNELGPGQRVKADTVNGTIRIYMPEDASARIVAETVNGSIDAKDFGLEAEKGFVGRDLEGEINGGDARVSLSTVNGSIKVKKN